MPLRLARAWMRSSAPVSSVLPLADAAANITAGATIALAIAALLALGSLVDAKKTRHAQLVTDLSRRWDDRFMHQALVLWREYGADGTVALVDALWHPAVTRRDPRDLRDWYRISVYPNLIETLGVYVHRDLISEELVYDLWGGSIIKAWDEWAPAVDRLRDHTKTEQVWENFETLAGLMKDRLRGEPRRSPQVVRSVS